MDFQAKIRQTITVEQQSQVTKFIYRYLTIFFLIQIVILLSVSRAYSQAAAPSFGSEPLSNTETDSGATTTATPAATTEDLVLENPAKELMNLDAKPDRKRIRRHLSLVLGVKTDEEFLIPNVPLSIKGPFAKNIEIQRIKDTDIFRMVAVENPGSGIVTIHNRKTGQIYVELHIDSRDGSLDKTLREVKSLLIDIEGIEYKIVNGGIVLDGYVLLPQDIIRIGHVLQNINNRKSEGQPSITSLVTLSPIARKRIMEYIAREINNPEVTVTAVGDYVKLEGSVNSEMEKTRIADLVALYLPNYVKIMPGGTENVQVAVRTMSDKATGDAFILNLITVRKEEEQEQPPPKMVQVVLHFVEFVETFNKWFDFGFNPTISTLASGGAAGAASPAGAASGTTVVNQTPTQPSTMSETANLISNLLPKLQWGKTHGYLRVLDTASVLVKSGSPGSITRGVNSSGAGGNTAGSMNLSVQVTPTISQPKSGLIDLNLTVTNAPKVVESQTNASTTITTEISVRDRQSAAFGGIINKGVINTYGKPKAGSQGGTGLGNSGEKGPIITLNAAKTHDKINGNYVVFVTPIIKTSASSGVEQVKKKFRLKE